MEKSRLNILACLLIGPTVFGSDLIRIQDVKTSVDSTCAVSEDGRLWCWGRINRALAPQEVTGLGEAVRDFSIKNDLACALGVTGKAWCWGKNGGGQAGIDSDEIFIKDPAEVHIPENLVAISVGDITSGTYVTYSDSEGVCGLGASGSVYCWGNGLHGKLGVGDVRPRKVPTKVLGIPEAATAIVTGSTHACALGLSGKVYCWGGNEFGSLGIGPRTDQDHAVQVESGSDRFTSLVAAEWATCGILSNGGGLKCWGGGSFPTTYWPTSLPMFGGSYVKAHVGPSHLCVVSSGNDFTCSGFVADGAFGQCQPASSGGVFPVLAGGMLKKFVGEDGSHACYLYQTGLLRCLGENDYGQLGLGDVLPHGQNECLEDVPFVTF